MSRIEKKYHYIYKTTNILNDKFYIGMHSTTDLNDEYFGSGKLLCRSMDKHGKENHVCEILEFLPDRESLCNRESEIINEELIADAQCMNIALGGLGGWDHVNSSLTKEQKIARSRAGWIAAGGVEFNRRNNKNFQKKLNADTEYRAWWLSTLKPPPDWTGKKHTAETIQKMKKIHKGKHEGEKNSQYGTRWIYSFVENKALKIKESQLREYLDMGWIRGRKPK